MSSILPIDPKPWREFICGWGSAVINITITYPIYKMIFRQMLHGVGMGNAFNQLSNEGLYFLYRGMLPPLCQKGLSVSFMFGAYNDIYKRLREQNLSYGTSLCLAGTGAGVIEGSLTPFERMQTLLQVSKYHDKFRNSKHLFQVILREHSIKEFYRGTEPILIRNSVANILFFYLRDELREMWPKTLPRTNVVYYTLEFTNGALIGALISTIIYPLNVVKIQMQTELGGPYRRWLPALVDLYKQRGLKTIYSGVHTNYLRSFLSWGIINASYEMLLQLF